MKRVLACIACALLALCIAPVAAIALTDSSMPSRYKDSGQLDGLSTEDDQVEKLLYTRTTTVGAGKYVNYINLTQGELDGKEITVRFTGSEPVMYPRQDGIGASGKKAWLYWKRIVAASVDDIDGTWKLAHFPADYVAAAWADHSVALGDAKQDGQVVVSPGDYNLIRFTTEGVSCTVDRVSLVGGEAPKHPGKSYAVSGKTASQIVRDMKVGWNLGNTLESRVGNSNGPLAEPDRADIEVELCWGNPKATRELIHFVKSQGFNAIRVPVSWFQHIYDDGRNGSDPTSVYHIDEAWMARVHEVVDYCYDEGLYVTVNTHHERLWLETPQFGDDGEHRELLKTELSAIWTQIATEFADYDQRLVFEGMNEPRASSEASDAVQVSHDREWGDSTPEDIETLNQLNQVFVDTVRSIPSPYRDTRLLLVNTIGGGTRLIHISQLRIPSNPADRSCADPYVGVSMHPYEPYHFTSSYGESWSDQTWSVANQVDLEQVIYRAYATFVSKGVPVVLDEFNSQDFGNTAAREEWAKAYLGLARGYGITCFLWDNGGAGANAAGNVTAYVDRWADTLDWVNSSQASVARAIIAAASDETSDVEWGSALDTAVPDGSPPVGRVLNEQPATSTGNSICTASVRMPEIEGGDIAAEFVGAAPTLVMTNKNGNGWTTLSPSYIAWNEGATGGVAYYWPDHVKRTWLASTKNADIGVEHTQDSLRQIKLTTSGTYTTVGRFVLTGADPLPDVSNGGYGDGVGARLLYTRPVALSYEKDSSGKVTSVWNTVAINVENPEVPGKDLAVRYTGSTPYLVFVDLGDDHGWHGWTSVRPYATAAADDGTGQRVSFFKWDDIVEEWQNSRAKDGESWQFDTVSVAVDNATCNLVELVALGGEVRKRPQMRAADEVLSGDDLVKALYAGYNLGGHMEANYVPLNGDGTPAATRDGGWGDADLDLEAHWSRGVYITRDTIHAIAERGFKTVRLPVTWFQHLHAEADSPYGADTIDRAWMARVHEIVDWCLEEDLYVVVNMHHENWIDRADLDTAYDETDLPVKFRTVWTQIAHEFDGYDQRLVFESMNEPHAEGCGTDREWNQPNAGDVSTVNRLNADFVALMRSMPAHANRLLMVPPFAASTSDMALDGFAVPEDPSDLIAVSLHNYTPHSYTHYFQGKTGVDPSGHVYTDVYRDNVDASFNRIRLNCTSKGWRVVLGEFGVPYSGEAHRQDQIDWMTQYITHAAEQGVPCIYWRMDQSSDGKVNWTMLDETTNAWTGLLANLVDRWFDILEDDDLEWGVDAYASADEHEDGASGQVLLEGPVKVDYSDSDNASWRTQRIPLTWDRMAGNELVVKFSGGRPRLSLLCGWNGMWWGIEPCEVDKENGIAYFSDKSVKAGWEGDGYDLADLQYACVRADGNLMEPDLQVQSVALVHRHEWGGWLRSQEPTCEQSGLMVRTCLNDASHELKREWGKPLGHDWADIDYRWSSDNMSVEATATCAHDKAHEKSATVAVSYKVERQPTASSAGSGSYTARFDEEPFETQTKIVLIPALADEPTSEVTGVVSGVDGPGAIVELSQNGETIASIASSSDGSYQIEAVPEGTYDLVAKTQDGKLYGSRAVAVNAGADSISADIDPISSLPAGEPSLHPDGGQATDPVAYSATDAKSGAADAGADGGGFDYMTAAVTGAAFVALSAAAATARALLRRRKR